MDQPEAARHPRLPAREPRADGVNGGDEDRDGDEDFHRARGQPQQTERTEHEGQRMPDGKRRDDLEELQEAGL